MMAVKKALRKQAVRYLKTCPGRDSLATNIRDHNLINECIHRPHLVGEESWDTLFTLLHYRTQAICAAERILDCMGISAPRADNIDIGEWRAEHPDLAKKTLVYHNLVLEYNLIPPHPGRSSHYIKAVQYIAAMCAASGLTEEELKRRLMIAQQGKLCRS